MAKKAFDRKIENKYVTEVRLRFARIAPRKVRIVADLIRGKRVEQAQGVLKFTSRRGAKILAKLLDSAVANIDRKEYPHPETLIVRNLSVDGGPTLKRMRPRAMGRWTRIRKRTSHVTLALGE